jgi:hypothetical protein
LQLPIWAEKMIMTLFFLIEKRNFLAKSGENSRNSDYNIDPRSLGFDANFASTYIGAIIHGIWDRCHDLKKCFSEKIGFFCSNYC